MVEGVRKSGWQLLVSGISITGTHMESGGCGSRASDLGARRQVSPKNLMRNVRCICYSEQKTLFALKEFCRRREADTPLKVKV